MHSEQAGSDRRWTSTLAGQLRSAEVELCVTLGESDLTLGDIVRLKVGDVIPMTLNDKVNATADGVPVMECRYGVSNGQYAIRVERFIKQEAEA
jgi:flagellar motor switch protein FliM